MADYTSINFGKPNWNKDINDTFDKIFAGGPLMTVAGLIALP